MGLYFLHYPNELLETAFYHDMEELRGNNVSREIVNTQYYQYFEHFSVNSVTRICRLWFEKCALNKPTFIIRISSTNSKKKPGKWGGMYFYFRFV